MTSYSSSDLTEAFKRAGIKNGDTLFLSARLSALGRLEGANSSQSFCQKIFDAIFEILGNNGTLVVPTYTQQVGCFGTPYIHESTPTPYGEFYEFIRKKENAVRSFHPVFSLTAVGAKAEAICGNVDTSAFGMNSAFGYLFRHGAKSASLGFEYLDGNIVKGAHYIEATYGVPYYYNKVVTSEVYRDGEKTQKVFVLNVGYREFEIQLDYSRFIETLNSRGMLRAVKIGDAVLFASDLHDQKKIGYELLSEDVYSFLKCSPQFVRGRIPFEGREAVSDAPKNWAGLVLADEWD